MNIESSITVKFPIKLVFSYIFIFFQYNSDFLSENNMFHSTQISH